MDKIVAGTVIVVLVFGMAFASGRVPFLSEQKRTIPLVAQVQQPAGPPPVAQPVKLEPEQWCANGRIVGGVCVIGQE
jgi:hypothetical protein